MNIRALVGGNFVLSLDRFGVKEGVNIKHQHESHEGFCCADFVNYKNSDFLDPSCSPQTLSSLQTNTVEP